jgi:hypothetical protein
VASGAPPATSGDTPASGTSAPTATPTTSAADQALDALLAEAAVPTTPAQPAAPPPAPSPENAAPAAPPTPPADPPPAAQTEPPATEHEDEEPSPAEVQSNHVPLKKLTRALSSRREIKQDLEKTKTELAQERALTDQVLATFNAAGVDAPNLKPFLAALANARSDDAARQTVARFLGINTQAAPAQATAVQIDMAKLNTALEAYDVDAIKSLLTSSGVLPNPAQPPPTPPAAPVQPPAPPAQPPRRADPAAPNLLVQTVATMGQTLRAQYGPQEAKRLADLIDAEAKTRITDMESLRVKVDVDAAAEVWKRALETVIKAEAHRRAVPATPPTAPPQPAPVQNTLRPQAPPTPTAQPRSADEQFNELVGASR